QVAIRYTQLNQYHVIMEVDPVYWQQPDTLNDIYLRGQSGTMVPLSAFTRLERVSTSLSVPHHGQFPAVTISFNVAPGKALGDAVNEVEEAARQMGMPAGIRGNFAGTAQA